MTNRPTGSGFITEASGDNRYPAFFNVKKYGAKGDNSTDDTTAIKAAIADAVAAGGGIVWFPRCGNGSAYKLTDTLLVNTTAAVWLAGEGGGYFTALGGSMLQYVGVANKAVIQYGASCINGGVTGLMVNQGNALTGVTGVLLNGSHITVRDVGVGNCTADGVGIIATTAHVSLCRLFSVTTQGCGTGLHLKGNNASNFDCNAVFGHNVQIYGSLNNDLVMEDRCRGNRIYGLFVSATHGTQPIKIGDGTIAAQSNYIDGVVEGVSGQTAITLADALGFSGSIRTNGVTTVLAGDSASSWSLWDATNGVQLEGGNRTNARKRTFLPLMDGADSGTVGTWGWIYLAAAPFANCFVNSSNAQNDAVAYYVDLDQGTYTAQLYGTSNANGAIATVDISFDAGSTWTSVGTQDQYAVSLTAMRTTFTGIVVPSKGAALLRFRALTRNASNSTGYTLRLSAASFVKTA